VREFRERYFLVVHVKDFKDFKDLFNDPHPQHASWKQVLVHEVG
jgi:hypothetical protein